MNLIRFVISLFVKTTMNGAINDLKMRGSVDERDVQILDNETDVWQVIRDISRSEAQEDAFYVCDLGNIVQKYKIWKNTLPRVQPFYGEYRGFREKTGNGARYFHVNIGKLK